MQKYEPLFDAMVGSFKFENPTILATSTNPITQVGKLTLIEYCNSKNVIDHIDVLDGTTTVQTITGFDVLMDPSINGSCPKPRVQDINFDGMPDFMIPTSYGATGNIVYSYWLFDASTSQFAGPGTLGGVNFPSFDNASKTVTTSWNMGCAGECSMSDTYQAINGKLVLVKEVDVEYFDSSDSYIQTTKELVNGQMQIVSTSTVSQGGQ